ncbi:hypothetical protein PP175_01315 [Aneurinibacillus sp. Ricciae_BoGa-3]|uniref:hypothetical protein n=1 Tax=Aneurinibacillus sp. Ricciae_BoGa-3 TaxID=3022697 RepID=UPI00234129CF|nr:hypothetical protein [Aneurinibacillus sp. Ricciae_BoGa-3]WCK54707.1 hypothetical protein PP175_01315 [Aneurinibacillus sp. Ricciae_BoGa-3]
MDINTDANKQLFKQLFKLFRMTRFDKIQHLINYFIDFAIALLKNGCQAGNSDLFGPLQLKLFQLPVSFISTHPSGIIYVNYSL